MRHLTPWRRADILGSDWDNFFDDFGMTAPMHMEKHMIKTDIRETDTAYILEAEIPGFAKEDVKIDLHDNLLTIKAEKSEEKEEKDENYLRRERCYGSMSRSFTVDNVDGEKIKAVHENGILKITMPKLKEIPAKEHHIRIE